MFRIIGYFLLLFPFLPFPWRKRKLKNRVKKGSETEPQKWTLWNQPQKGKRRRPASTMEIPFAVFWAVFFSASLAELCSGIHSDCPYFQRNLHSSYSYWFMVFLSARFSLLPPSLWQTLLCSQVGKIVYLWMALKSDPFLKRERNLSKFSSST